MILKPTGLICTRYQVQKIAAQNADVTEVDFSEAEVIGVSTMHQFLLSFPGAQMTGLYEWNKEQYDMVLQFLDEIEQRRGAIGLDND